MQFISFAKYALDFTIAKKNFFQPPILLPKASDLISQLEFCSSLVLINAFAIQRQIKELTIMFLEAFIRSNIFSSKPFNSSTRSVRHFLVNQVKRPNNDNLKCVGWNKRNFVYNASVLALQF